MDIMQKTNGRSPEPVAHAPVAERPVEQTPGAHSPAADVASLLIAAQERALEQRLAAEALLAEARLLEERLANEVRMARAGAERELAQVHAAEAIAAAQLEREAILEVEACEANLLELGRQNELVTSAVREARAAREAAAACVTEAERRLDEARMALGHADRIEGEASARHADVAVASTLAEAQASDAAKRLAEHRAARQAAETASREAHERALALGPSDGADSSASLDPLEDLQLLQTRIALRAEAAKRAAERRASDEARNNVIH